MSIQIFTEQSVLFNHPEDKYTTFEVKCFEFVTAPNWILDSSMFKMLQRAGKIKVLNGNDKYVENNGKIAKVVEEDLAPSELEKVFDEPAPVVEEEPVINDNEVQNFSEMSNRELYEVCHSKGINAEPKKNKEYYLNLLAKKDNN